MPVGASAAGTPNPCVTLAEWTTARVRSCRDARGDTDRINRHTTLKHHSKQDTVYVCVPSTG